MIRPIEPAKEDCCNSGCNPCIFDVYENQLKLYERSLKDNTIVKPTDNAISQLKYNSFIVLCNHTLDSNHRLIAFKTSTNKNEKQVWWNAGQHFLYKYTDSNNKQYTRAYTPLVLKGVINVEEFDFMIIVKNYMTPVSSSLCSLNVGDITFWRGPYGSYEIISNKYKRLIMIAQGTGIAPLYSVMNEMLLNDEEYTKIILLFCCRNVDEILLRKEIHNLASYWNFTYKIYIGNISSPVQRYYKEPIESHRLKEDDLVVYEPYTTDDQILLCGSSEFMTYYRQLFSSKNISEENIVLF